MLSLLLAIALQAAHPCDGQVFPDRTRAPFGVGVCWAGTDEPDGQPTTALELRVYLDGVRVATVPNPQPMGPPNAEGLSYYLVPGLTAPKGSHVLTVTIVNEVGESLPSDPFPFTVIGGPPTKPVRPRVDPR